MKFFMHQVREQVQFLSSKDMEPVCVSSSVPEVRNENPTDGMKTLKLQIRLANKRWLLAA